jgi:apolipoprotein D and lipocalin family protein
MLTCKIKILVLVTFLFLSGGCVKTPYNVTPVTNFEPERYLGTWYEIARLDHSFERGLEKVTANYSKRDDGGIKVINRGFDPIKNRWKEAEGKAYFVKTTDVGLLKVSFFGPFYGGYNIIELDQKEYSWSVVCGPDRSYLWILAREPQLDKSIIDALVMKIKSYGFYTDELIYVKHQ